VSDGLEDRLCDTLILEIKNPGVRFALQKVKELSRVAFS
jgi:hypothetical protein